MKTIMVPTDFSDCSANALEYAIWINGRLNAELLLFHSYFVPFPVTEIPVAMPGDVMVKQSAAETLNGIVKKYSGLYPGMKFSSEMLEGFSDIEILEEIALRKPDLIVIGTHGISTVKKIFFGSNTAAVIEKAGCPVIAVPDGLKLRRLNRIVFAANFGKDDCENACSLVQIARLFSAKVILLHLCTKGEEMIYKNEELKIFRNRVAELAGYENIDEKVMEGDDLYHGINNYLNETKADLFVINMRNRSFFQRIIQPGLTNKIVNHAQIPVMVYHTSL
jgi:nucleotide-binding universal stress UspA family protein